MGDTTKGLPYPVDADVNDVPADIQALAEAVDAALVQGYTTVQRDALLVWTGRTIYNTTTFQEEVWNGAAWVAIGGASAAEDVTFAPAGSIVATDVQAALVELDVEKQALSEKGQNNGYASLDAGGDVPLTQLGNVPAGAMTEIAETVLGSDTASITFSSIPATYNHLLLVVSGRGDDAAAKQDMNLRFNGSSSGVYSWESFVVSAGAAVYGGVANVTAAKAGEVSCAGATSNVPSMTEILIANYWRTTFQKSFSAKGAAARGGDRIDIHQFSGSWYGSAAINAIQVYPAAGNFKAGTVATLYGVS